MKDDSEDHKRAISKVELSRWIKENLNRPDPFGWPLVVISLVFVSFLFASPFLVEEDSLDLGDEGSVGAEDHGDAISGINNSVARIVYGFGDRYCHQKDHRSWDLNGNQMPVCSRDVGLFIGIFIGCTFGASYRRGIKLLILLFLLLPMAIDGGLQSITSYESFNSLRLITGMIGGFGVGAYVNGTIVQSLRILTYKKREG